MTASSKLTWGLIIAIGGFFLVTVGLLLSFTLIGACFGIPMGIAGPPLMIWGVVWTIQGRSGRQENAIASGIQRGLANATPPTASVPPRQPSG